MGYPPDGARERLDGVSQAGHAITGLTNPGGRAPDPASLARMNGELEPGLPPGHLAEANAVPADSELAGPVSSATVAAEAPDADAAQPKQRTAGKPGTPRARGGSGGRPRRPSLGGGTPAQERELGRQGRETVRKLLEAGLAEFDERGFQAVRVDDVVRRAKTSHGTFYLYVANKDDLFKTLLRDALHEMEIITGDFPVVTRNEAGREALRAWVRRFCDTYAAHATVIRIRGQHSRARRRSGGRPPRARGTDRRCLPDDAGARQLSAERRGQAAKGRDGGPAQRHHLRRVQ